MGRMDKCSLIDPDEGIGRAHKFRRDQGERTDNTKEDDGWRKQKEPNRI